jgi:hypothetical protein
MSQPDRRKLPIEESLADKLRRLRNKANVITGEYDLASSFHEAWKPTIYDADLQARIGESLAANTFLVIRDALRREMVLALMRIWDTGNDSLSLSILLQELDIPGVMESYIERSTKRLTDVGIPIGDQILHNLRQVQADLHSMITEYTEGEKRNVYERLRRLRNDRLAHNLTTSKIPSGPSLTDVEIEQFYVRTGEIVKLLLHLIHATAYLALASTRDLSPFGDEPLK